VYLRAGEDPLTHETQAREIGLNGPLMAFGAAPGAGSTAGGDSGFKQSLEPVIRCSGFARLSQRLADLVEDLILADDRTVQSRGNPDQMPHRVFAHFHLEARVQVWHGAEPV